MVQGDRMGVDVRLLAWGVVVALGMVELLRRLYVRDSLGGQGTATCMLAGRCDEPCCAGKTLVCVAGRMSRVS